MKTFCTYIQKFSNVTSTVRWTKQLCPWFIHLKRMFCLQSIKFLSFLLPVRIIYYGFKFEQIQNTYCEPMWMYIIYIHIYCEIKWFGRISSLILCYLFVHKKKKYLSGLNAKSILIFIYINLRDLNLYWIFKLLNIWIYLSGATFIYSHTFLYKQGGFFNKRNSLFETVLTFYGFV